MADTEHAAEPLHFRLRREAGGFLTWLRNEWREKRWVRWLGYAALALVALRVAAWAFRPTH